MKRILTFLFWCLLASKIYAQAPTISYTGSPYTFTVGTAISALTPAVTGSPVINGQTSTFAGTGSAGYVNGTGTGASFNQPIGMAVDASGNIYISDVGNEVIRKITPAGAVTTFAGTGSPGSANGTGTSASFYHPVQMCIDASGNIYIADEDNNMIRKMTPAGVVTTLAGQTTAGYTNATGTSAKFNLPCGVAVDASGNVYVADYTNNAIRKITSAGVVTTFAGSTTGASGSANGTGTAATFNHPFSLAIDGSGNMYVADRSNNMIRKIVLSTAVVTTLAGQTAAGHANGTGTAATFSTPTTVTTDAPGNVYVADESNNMIRKITSAGVVTTLSGASFDDDGWVDGVGTVAEFYNPFAVATDPYGNIFVCDLTKDLVRKVVSTPYTITPVLPAGLTFNTATGVISGTPTTATTATTYTAADYNASGMGTVAIQITTNILGPSTAQNYILTYTPRVAGLDPGTFPTQTPANVNQTVQYIDGLGRPLQTVQRQASATGRDLVQPMAYDQYDREAVKYLPYSVLPTAPSDGSYKSTALTDQASFYANPGGWTAPGVVTTSFPTANTAYEASPLNRPIEQGAPGDNWQLTGTAGAASPGHTVKIAYATNDASSLTSGTGYWAKNYGVTYLYSNEGVFLYKNALADNGAYGTDILYVTITKNENWSSSQTNLSWNTTQEYKDKFGRVVLKRTFNYNSVSGLTETYSTYYVYDNYNNLTYVLPPGANPDAGGITQATLDNLCYQYRYDGRNRMIGKKIPGKGWDLVLYSALDQPVAMQDSVQRMKSPQEWTITKYDAMGRVVLTGTYQYSGSTAGVDYRATLQSLVDAQSAQWETPITTGNGYTATTWPTAWTTTLTLAYYDKYSAPSLPYSYTSASNMTRGLATASKVAILNTPTTMLWSQQYYDDQDRVTRAYQQHYLGGTASVNNYDLVTTTYNFTGQPTTVTRQHWNTTSTTYPLVTVANTYIYDQVGRKLKTWEQITNGNSSPTTKTLISQIDYNEVGQAMTKHLHSTDSLNFLQNIAYTYNERGWLLSSSAPLFAMQLYYNTGTNKAYNGNIMYQYWGVPGNLNNNYSYSYDNLNRLTAGNSYTSYSENNISYDLMGNIKTLYRYVPGPVLIDNLAYTYTSGGNATNQVQSIADATTNNNGLVAGTTNYTYDGNGNELSATNTVTTTQNKTFTYNLLNLPQTAVVPTGTLTYTYDASGNKLRKVSTATNNTTDYIAGIQYDGATTPALSFIQTEEGKAVPNGTGYDYVYYLGDNLGNTRITFGTKTGTAVSYQSDDYYPFGMEINNSVLSPKNEYLYNKKELQEELQEYDYGARMYDPIIARWMVIDPLAETSRRWSPYNYVENNPIRFIDPDGMELTDYYNENGDKVKHVEDGSNDKVMVLTTSKNPSKVDAAIANGDLAPVASTEVLNKMDDAYSQTETTGNEHSFAVATDGTTGSMETGNSDMVHVDVSYEDLTNAGKTPSYDVHTHDNTVDNNGQVVGIGQPTPSGTNGGTPGKKGDTDAYGKNGENKNSVVLGYKVDNVPVQSSIGGASTTIGGQQTTQRVTKMVGFYNGNGPAGKTKEKPQQGKVMEYDQYKKASQKINGQ